MRAKIFGLLGDFTGEKGNMIREPYSKHIGDGIFELRCKFGSDITRVLYFFIMRKNYIDHWVCKEDTEDSKGRDTDCKR